VFSLLKFADNPLKLTIPDRTGKCSKLPMYRAPRDFTNSEIVIRLFINRFEFGRAV